MLQRHNREMADAKPHLNLYGYDGDQSILFTQDHLIPYCLGEKRTRKREDLDNLDTCCYPCNMQKNNSLPKWMTRELL